MQPDCGLVALASGRATVATADPHTGLSDEVQGCGICMPPGDAAAFATAIERLADQPRLRETFGAEARRRAQTRWDRSTIIEGFEQDLLRLVGQTRGAADRADQARPISVASNRESTPASS